MADGGELLFKELVAVLVSGALLCLPYLHPDPVLAGIWFRSEKGRRLAILTAIISLVSTPVIIVSMEFLVGTPSASGEWGAVFSRGMVPGLFSMAGLAGYYYVLRKWVQLTRTKRYKRCSLCCWWLLWC